MALISRALLVLVGALCLVSSVQAVANLVVLKELDVNSLSLNKEIQVTFTLFNLGDEPATLVRVLDSYWPEAFVDVAGLRDFAFNEIAPGTNVTHTLVVKPTQTGVFNVPPARVGYLESKGAAALTRSISTTVGYVRVLDSQAAEATELHTFEWVIFGFLSAASVLLPSYVVTKTRTTLAEVSRS
eukprot:c10576_g1_i1.p2 GENE.c10576_g1_i1~~c10576_g1_i1.p2  ORF type:complete len:185 (+),score=53.31 c10576_g1_i1:52-606(+)